MANGSQILQMAEELTVLAHNYLKVNLHQSKRGGYLTVLNWKREELVLSAKIGQISNGMAEKAVTLADEKAWRLCIWGDLRTSFECRNPEAEVYIYDKSTQPYSEVKAICGHWGGAVRGNRYIFSFSGFGESLDEAMMFALAIRQKDLSLQFVLQCFEERNKHLVPFLRHCGLMKK